MSAWMALALPIILVGALVILSRVHLLSIALVFWVTFAAGIAVIAASGHAMTARWHLGPITGFEFWRVLVLSPEVMIFLFFMITDPKTTPRGRVGRRVYAVSVALLAVLLIAPMSTEFWTKVMLLLSLTVVCAVAARSRSCSCRGSRPRCPSLRRPALGALAVGAAVVFAGALVLAGLPARPEAAARRGSGLVDDGSAGRDRAPVEGRADAARRRRRRGRSPPTSSATCASSPRRSARAAASARGAAAGGTAPAGALAADRRGRLRLEGDHRPGADGVAAQAQPRDPRRAGAAARDRAGDRDRSGC